MGFSHDVSLSGELKNYKKEKTAFLECDANSIVNVLESLKALSDKYKNDTSLAHLTTIVKGLSETENEITEEIHYHKRYCYSSNYITGHKYIDVDNINDKDLISLEGFYTIKQNKEVDKIYLEFGNIYIPDKDNENQYTKKIGKYTVSKDFITMEFDKEDGSTFKQLYLIADYIMPTDFSINPNLSPSDVQSGNLDKSRWYNDIKGDIKKLKGKKIRVLVLQFYSIDEIK